jgi:hypothetical protein
MSIVRHSPELRLPYVAGRRHTVAWEWQVWRCFDNIRDTFEEKGWEYRFDGRNDNEVVPLLAESGDYCITFFERDPGTGECWFELRDRVRRRVVFVQGARNIPTPDRAAKLLVDHGAWSEISIPRERPTYSLPVVPVVPMAEAG